MRCGEGGEGVTGRKDGIGEWCDVFFDVVVAWFGGVAVGGVGGVEGLGYHRGCFGGWVVGGCVMQGCLTRSMVTVTMIRTHRTVVIARTIVDIHVIGGLEVQWRGLRSAKSLDGFHR